MQDKIIAS